MILHCVFCNFRDDTTVDDQNSALKDLETFSLTLDGVQAFDYGPNRDFELRSQDYDQGFVIRFEDAKALAHYAEHPTHKTLGRHLSSLCTGGPKGIIVFDLEV